MQTEDLCEWDPVPGNEWLDEVTPACFDGESQQPEYLLPNITDENECERHFVTVRQPPHPSSVMRIIIMVVIVCVPPIVKL